MRSPFTGGEAVLLHEKRQAVFRKECFDYDYRYYKCSDTGQIFTTTQLDTVNLSQIHNQYRVKYGIPFPDEIKATRLMYGFSASKMSRILGFGENTYRLYENGEMPNVANGKTLMAIQSPSVFRRYLDDSRDVITQNDYLRCIKKIEENVAESKVISNLVYGNVGRGQNNGYTYQSLSKLKNVILYFIEKMGGVFVTKMNKLLFYSDFASYRDYGQSITGLAYKAIQYGPVPVSWDVTYGLLDDIEQVIVEFDNGNSGQELVSKMPFDSGALTKEQIEVLERVYTTFRNDTSVSISKKSHEEDAWIENENGHKLIDFNYAFSLKHI